MYAQLRVYTVNRGKMDDWVRWFNDKLTPVAKQAGHTILGPWVNEAKTEFVWIRAYDSADDAKAKDERFYSSAGWKALAPEAGAFIAKAEVTVMNSAQVPARAG
jgi:hypothetical protein